MSHLPTIVTGCDVVDVGRLSAVADRRAGFVRRVFTDVEVADCTRGGIELTSPTGRARLAARFAAKEATRKAIGDLRLPFHAIEVRRDTNGAPRLHLYDRPLRWSCSLSHDAGVAMAVVVGFTAELRRPDHPDLRLRPDHPDLRLRPDHPGLPTATT